VLEAIGNLAAENSAAKFFTAGTYENRGNDEGEQLDSS